MRIVKSVSAAPRYQARFSHSSHTSFPIQTPDEFTLGVQNCEQIQHSDQLEDRQTPTDHDCHEGSKNGRDYDKREEGEPTDGNQEQGGPGGGNQGEVTDGPEQDDQEYGGEPDGNGQGTDNRNQNDQVGGGEPDGNDQGDPSYTWKRSNTAEDCITPASAISSIDSQTLEELVFFLKLILCVLLSFVLILAYFVVPTRVNRRLQTEYRVHAVVPCSVSVQDFKV